MLGNIRKMHARLDQPVSYSLSFGTESICINDYLEKKISLKFTGKINCVHCGRKTNKSFNQGYCYPCFQTLAQCDSCIVSPEKCHYDQGSCREPVWGEEFCLQDHIVYLANSSGIKVGITRSSQIPTRWIDQGAIQALPIFRVRTRQQSGFVEQVFKQHVADKTNWRTMLKGNIEMQNLEQSRTSLLQQCHDALKGLEDQYGIHGISVLNGMETVNIDYPVIQYPSKINSLNLDKTPCIEGVLLGIKGQYLLLDNGVINVRKYSGYELEFSATS